MDNNENTTGGAPEAPETGAQTTGGVAAALSQELTETEAGAATRDEEAPKPAEALPIDFSKLTPEQLQLLKGMLNATPDRVRGKTPNPKVLLRKIKDRFIIDFKPSFMALHYDPVRLTDVETIKIPVKFLGDTEYTEVLYKEFMQADQVPVEVVQSRFMDSPRVEGEVVQRETGRVVEMEVNERKYFFTVKLPEGAPIPQIEIEAKIANA